MSLFDFEENPENIAVIVIVAAAAMFFLCVYCTFVQPVLSCLSHIFGFISRLICCHRSEYASVNQV